MFDTLDFLATVTSELHLAGPDVPVTTGTRPARSTGSKAEKLSVFWVRPHTRGCPSRCFLGVGRCRRL
jgi:hypothetical protein